MTTTEPTTPPTEPVGEPAPVDHEAEAKRLRAEVDKLEQARKRDEEKVRKANAAQRELDELRKTSMTEQERAVAEARDAARAEVMAEMGGSLVDAEVRLALTGRMSPDSIEAQLESLNRASYLGTDGKPDAKRISAWAERVAPTPDPSSTPGTPRPIDMGQGNRGPIVAPSTDPREQFGQFINKQLGEL